MAYDDFISLICIQTNSFIIIPNNEKKAKEIYNKSIH